jgi:uncharacterized protein YjbI with pentapeptide repeats
MKTKLQIHSIFGNLLFEYECEDNTIAKTVSEAVRSSANLSYADLRSANLSYADLRSANLRYANLRSADLSYANLSSANLSSANLRSADLSYADLSYADLSSANLSSANLRSADLSYADLSYADLRSANLRYADLRYAKTDKRYIQIGCIGSAKRMTTYCFEDDIVMCGCFTGTLKEFEKKVKENHKDNPQYLKEYTGAIKYIKSLK